MKIAIFGRPTRNTNYDTLEQFFSYLEESKVDYSIHAAYGEALMPFITRPFNYYQGIEEISGVDFLYCIGGDGTILEATRFVGRYQIPILGVNAGRLGFLAQVSQYELIAVTEQLAANAWREDRRTLIEVESCPEGLFTPHNFGMNEVSIHKTNSNEMIIIHTYVNGEFLNSYWADGLIISTPTGSTAYSLAAGGPIIAPHCNTFVLTPIAPHSLTVRAIVIPDGGVVSFEIETRSGKALVAIDNRTKMVDSNIALAVRKADFTACLVKPLLRSYFLTLRNRLNWGADSRN